MHSVMMEGRAIGVLDGLPHDTARDEVLEVLERVRERPEHYPRVPGPGARERRQAFGDGCWLLYGVRDDAIEVHDIGWLEYAP
ncbi:hypothetical protein [Streptomyces sp. ODS28]|uniref:hypothetical protein n=1 Tax=Streptomyces sp. ODS28 TaxID=3136688 RepID=UPI0031E8E5CA